MLYALMRRPPQRGGGGLVVLRGNICPNGAILEQGPQRNDCFRMKARRLSLRISKTRHRRVDDPHLDMDENSVMVLKNAGTKGAPGMPEWGHLPIPKKFLARGVSDLVAYGTAILHGSPESANGGPLVVVKTGDRIELDVRNRRLTLKVEDREIAPLNLGVRASKCTRGYGQMFLNHVLGAEEGCDFRLPPRPLGGRDRHQTYG